VTRGLTFDKNYYFRDQALERIHLGELDAMFVLDQLSQQIKKEGSVWYGFKEGAVQFNPTYKVNDHV
jgi:hypothetical protein